MPLDDVVNEPFRSGVVVALRSAVPEPVKPPRSAAIVARCDHILFVVWYVRTQAQSCICVQRQLVVRVCIGTHSCMYMYRDRQLCVCVCVYRDSDLRAH